MIARHDDLRPKLASTVRRLLLLEVLLVFSLYLLLFTIIHGILNYETAVTHALIGQVEIGQSMQSATDLFDSEVGAYNLYQANPTTANEQNLDNIIIRTNERITRTHDAVYSLPDEVSTIRQNEEQNFQDADTSYTQFVTLLHKNVKNHTTNSVSAEQDQVTQSFSLFKKEVSDTSNQLQDTLNASLDRRTALLGLQAIIVIASMLAVTYTYIAPSFERVARKLLDQNRELKHLDEVKMEFLSIASHQLKTPLSGLKWNLSLLSRSASKGSADTRRYIAQANAHTDAMVRLVSNFLNVSRIEQGRIQFRIERVSIVPIVKAVFASNKRLAEVHHITLALDTPSNNVMIKTDALLIKQVMQNLVDNAIVYNRDGGMVTVKIELKPSVCVVKVGDTGHGIPQSEQSKIFTEFYRGANALRMRPDGSGLGLYFVKKILHKMNGGITVKSVVGEGTTFTFELPR